MEKHRKKLIKNATVFDGHSSGLAQGKKIVIEDDIVTEITADEVSEENFDEVFDGTGMVAMPGMTDAHVHMGCLFAKGEFPVDYATVLTVAKCKNALMAGFTTFRDAGSVSEGLKLAFDEGVLRDRASIPAVPTSARRAGMGIRVCAYLSRHPVQASVQHRFGGRGAGDHPGRARAVLPRCIPHQTDGGRRLHVQL